jgi:two-component system response regulator GlrR
MNDDVSTAIAIASIEQRENSSEPRRRGATILHKPRIMVVDGDPATRRLIGIRLRAADYAVETVGDAQAALDACIRVRPNLVITDLRLGKMDGLAFLKELKSRWSDMTVIIVTDHDTIPEAVLATQRGAFSFLVKPVEKAELLGHVERAIADSTSTLQTNDWQTNLISRNRLMEYRLQEANWAARSDVPVLLTGQSATGKELLARAVHAASERRQAAFIVVNCANHAERSVELELFGNECGEFSGSFAELPGAVCAARGGTLLLNDIADLPLRLQERLVAALRDQSVHFNCHDSRIAIDVRLICTTSRDIRPMIDTGSFSQKLFYQINILPIEIPPLGRRREDMPLLISHFLEQATQRCGVAKIYSATQIAKLATKTWPKHVQQLFDLVKKDVELTRDGVIPEAFARPPMDWNVVQDRASAQARDRLERDRHQYELDRERGAPTLSARVAKRNRNEFYKFLGRIRTSASHADGPTRSAANRRNAPEHP